MQVGNKVKIKGIKTTFTIDCYVNGWALLRFKRDKLTRIYDWVHATDLIALQEAANGG